MKRPNAEQKAFYARLARRSPVELGRRAAISLDEVRAEREEHLLMIQNLAAQ